MTSIRASGGCQPEAISCCQPGSAWTSRSLTVWRTPALASAAHCDARRSAARPTWTRRGSSTDREQHLVRGAGRDARAAGTGASWACSQGPSAVRDWRA